MKKQQEFIYCKHEWRGIHCEKYRLRATASNNILESAIQEEDMLFVTLSLIVKRNMLCVTASLIMKKICCVLLPASL